jgi:hypothetical protein
MAPKPGQDYGNGGWGGSQRSCGRGSVFAPLMGLIWFFLILGGVYLFGLGGGDRPLAIVLFLAALALVKRLFGVGRRRRGGGPRGPRGPRGRRRW